MFPLFIYCTSGHCLSKSSLQLMLVSAFTSWNSRNKRTYFAQVRLYCVLLKKKTTSVWWVKSNWFDFIHYTEIIFLSKNVIFLYILKFFLYVTLENIFRILNNCVYFQNIVVRNEALNVCYFIEKRLQNRIAKT